MKSSGRYDIFSAGRRDTESRITEVTKEASQNLEQAKEVIIDMLEIGLLEFKKREKTLKTTAKVVIRNHL